MKIFLNRKYLEAVTNEHFDLLETEDMQYQKERIQGMINNNIHFCSLVTGYRGTGKSTFVDYVLDEFEKSKENNILVVKINAIYYKEYERFIKRFIRELFFQYGGVEGSPDGLTELYYHTFYDIKTAATDSVKEEILGKKESKISKEIRLSSENDLNKIKNNILKYALEVCLLFVGANIGNGIFFKAIVLVLIVVLVIMIFLDFKLYLSWNKETTNSNTKEDIEKSERVISIESLYDDEIAEYHLFDQLKEAKKSGKKVVFVLDELDKIENQEDIDRIFHDLKPLFLSADCDFVLVGGIELERYLQEKSKEEDAIVKSIFSNKVYIPLSTISDLREFAIKFYDKVATDVEDDSLVWKYFDKKIYESKGIKRCFVNGLLADLRWEGDKPYIDIASDGYDKEQEKIIKAYENVEKYINENYEGKLRDCYILLLYALLDRLLTRKQEKISLASLVKEEFELRVNNDITVEEVETLCQTLLNEMVDLRLIKKEAGRYEWYFNVTSEEVRSDEVTDTDFNEEYYKSVLQFVDYVENMLNVLRYFAKMQGVRIHEDNESLDEYDFLFGEDFEIREEWQEAIYYYKKAQGEGISTEYMPFIRLFNESMRIKKCSYLIRFLKTTYKYFYNVNIDETPVRENSSRRDDVDIICKLDNPKVILLTEVKYYRTYNQAIDIRQLKFFKSYVEKLVLDGYEREKIMLKIVVFTNGITEKRYEKYKGKSKEMLREAGLDDVGQMFLVDLNDYEQFSIEMRDLLEL